MPFNWKTLLGFGSGVIAHEAAEQVLSNLFKQVGERGTEFLKSSVLGLGTNDEALFRSAVSYAVMELKADPKEIHRVVTVIGSLPFTSRSRVIQIIGKDEREVPVKMPVYVKGTGEQKKDKDGNPIFAEYKICMNVRGGRTLAYFATLNDQEIIKEIHASNMSSHLAENIDVVKDAAKNAFDDLGARMNSGNTLLDRWANRFK